MGIRIRLARHHLTRNAPRFDLVATQSSARATARPLERLGEFDPLPVVQPPPSRSPNGHLRDERDWGARQFLPRTAQADVGVKHVRWNLDRVRYWLSQGAIPSKPVERLLVQAGVLKTDPRPAPATTGLVMSRQRRIREAVRAAERARGEAPVAQR
ncbi:hypothetical protein Rhopal_006970-T1 [Rhodotorula paludigena]|uniref:Ribosomal protein S16 n=1 Tax=Rhodotorula paludigena TaxID=86838 RepID=A0AAV5GWP6_9BASI|nr:hypothetical protein Rhopal_006970-T1 [Rhodotorula paludigena]